MPVQYEVKCVCVREQYGPVPVQYEVKCLCQGAVRACAGAVRGEVFSAVARGAVGATFAPL